MNWGRENTVAVGITGASGALYALRLIDSLLAADRRVWLMVSRAGRMTLAMEEGLALPVDARAAGALLTQRFGAAAGQIRCFGADQWSAPPASGSGCASAMVVCPCTMGTLAAIANGASDTLLERAADVTIKEGRRLILVPRETPLSAIHLENMLKLARIGVCILPANPGLYHRPAPRAVDDLIDFVVARILDRLEIPHQLIDRWGLEGDAGSPPSPTHTAGEKK